MRTFLWLVAALMGMCCRSDLAGVTSFVRVLGLKPGAYQRLLYLFHSRGLDLEKLTTCWLRLVPVLFKPFLAGGEDGAKRWICLADGIKIGKEGRKMPGVKHLHQESGSNSKAEWIMGHSLQAISLLVEGAAGQVAAVPLASRIHEGLKFTNRDRRTLLDKLVALLLPLAETWGRKLLLVADAYYANRSIIIPLNRKGHHLVSRVKSNAVAFHAPVHPAKRGRGRPRLYGERVKLHDLFEDEDGWIEAPGNVYGEETVMIRYRCLDLLWKPVGRVVRFVLSRHPTRGNICLICTDLSLEPLAIIQLYGYRFKIETGFRQAVHTVGGYLYHFWMQGMKRLHRGDGDQHLHRVSKDYRAGVRRKLGAYHAYVQIGCIAQGLMIHLAMNHTSEVWASFQSWLRTIRPGVPPSELVVAHALRSSLPGFFREKGLGPEMTKILQPYLAMARVEDPPGRAA
jgi:hypothetical protein